MTELTWGKYLFNATSRHCPRPVLPLGLCCFAIIWETARQTQTHEASKYATPHSGHLQSRTKNRREHASTFKKIFENTCRTLIFQLQGNLQLDCPKGFTELTAPKMGGSIYELELLRRVFKSSSQPTFGCSARETQFLPLGSGAGCSDCWQYVAMIKGSLWLFWDRWGLPVHRFGLSWLWPWDDSGMVQGWFLDDFGIILSWFGNGFQKIFKMRLNRCQYM